MEDKSWNNPKETIELLSGKGLNQEKSKKIGEINEKLKEDIYNKTHQHNLAAALKSIDSRLLSSGNEPGRS